MCKLGAISWQNSNDVCLHFKDYGTNFPLLYLSLTFIFPQFHVSLLYVSSHICRIIYDFTGNKIFLKIILLQPDLTDRTKSALSLSKRRNNSSNFFLIIHLHLFTICNKYFKNCLPYLLLKKNSFSFPFPPKLIKSRVQRFTKFLI